MASREALLRVLIDDGAFAQGLRRAGDEVKQVATRMGTTLGHELHGGLEKGVEGVKRLGEKLKEALTVASGIGGAIGFEEMIRHAVEAEDVADNIAMKLRMMGEQTKTGDVLEHVNEVSKRMKVTTGEALTAYERLLDKTAEPVFSSQALDSVALMQNAFHVTAESSADMVAAIRNSFGATADQIKSEYAPAIRDALGRSGVTFEQLSGHAATLGSVMHNAGMKGVEGWRQALGLLTLTKGGGEGVGGAVGDPEKRMVALETIFRKLGTKQELKMFGKEAGVDTAPLLKMHSVMDRFSSMLGSQKGFTALQDTFTRGGMNDAFKALTTSFRKGHDAKLMELGLHDDFAATAAQKKAAAQAGLDAFQKALTDASTAVNKEEDLKREAAIQAEDTSRKMVLAMGRFNAALENEKFLGALGKLANILPVIAEKFAKVAEFAIDHPVAAGAAVVGGQFAMSALPGLLTTAIGSAFLKSGGAGDAMAKSFAGSSAIGSAGSQIGAAAAGQMLLASAGIGAAIGTYLWKEIVEPAQKKLFEDRRNKALADTDVDVAIEGKSLPKKKKALEILHKQFLDETSHGHNETNPGKLREILKKQHKLEQEIDSSEALIKTKEREAKASELLAQANESAARRLAKHGHHHSTRGVNRPPAVVPGHEVGSMDTLTGRM